MSDKFGEVGWARGIKSTQIQTSNVPNSSTNSVSAIRGTLGSEKQSFPTSRPAFSFTTDGAGRPSTADRAGRCWNECARPAPAFEWSAPHSGTFSPDAARRHSVIPTPQIITFPTLAARACPWAPHRVRESPRWPLIQWLLTNPEGNLPRHLRDTLQRGPQSRTMPTVGVLREWRGACPTSHEERILAGFLHFLSMETRQAYNCI